MDGLGVAVILAVIGAVVGAIVAWLLGFLPFKGTSPPTESPVTPSRPDPPTALPSPLPHPASPRHQLQGDLDDFTGRNKQIAQLRGALGNRCSGGKPEEMNEHSKMPTVFISYSRRDKHWLERLQVMLKPLVRVEEVQPWDDTRIEPGAEWRREIEQALERAAVAVFLVSPDFLASDFIHEVELPHIFDAANRGTLTVLWVLLRPCMYEETRIAKYQAVHDPSKPLASLTKVEQDHALKKVCEAVKRAASRAPRRPVSGTLEKPGKVRPGNPYDPWTPATPPRFVGRADILRQLQNALEEQRSVSLVGDSRIGKTSILRTWEATAQGLGREVRFVSGEDGAGASCSALVKAITALNAPDEPDAAADVLSRWAQGVVAPGLPSLILLDEADGLARRLPLRFFERLRGMLGGLALVFASRRELDHLFSEKDTTSPLAGRLQLEWVGLLEADAAETIIRRHRGTLSDTDQALMHDWAGRHPFYLDLLGRHLVHARQSESSVQEALDRFQAEAAMRLRSVWDILQEPERKTLLESLGGVPAKRRSLRMRGLVTDEGKPFGKVLKTWLNEEL